MKEHFTNYEYWQSLKAQAEADEPRLGTPSRRRFMQLAAASMALAGLSLSGCRRWPEEKLAPYTAAPQNRLPGMPLQYATAMELGGVAMPLLVTSFDGRPIKIEGNPTHPWSATIPGKQGAATAIAQASILDLYDPHRSRTVVNNTGKTPAASDFPAFAAALRAMLASAGQGEKVAVLLEATSSPSTARMKELVLKAYPKLGWYEYEPLSRDNEAQGIKLATGKAGRTVLHLDKAAVVVSFDDDFLGSHPAQIRYASDWAARRRSADDADAKMSRLYAFESALTLTGTMADVRVPVKPSHVLHMLAAMANGLRIDTPGFAPAVTADKQAVIRQIVKDIDANRGAVVITAGPSLPPEAHHLVTLINVMIGSQAVTLLDDGTKDRPTHLDAIKSLSDKLKAGAVDALLILGGNPVYDAPADLNFAELMKSVAHSVHLGVYANETSQLAKWHVPRAHYLESWGDARVWDGTIGIVQPLIEPLFGGKTIDEILALVAASDETASEKIVQNTYTSIGNTDWRKALRDGLVENSAFDEIKASIDPHPALTAPPSSERWEVRFLPSAGMYDGRFAANGWLQEIPDTLTKIVWDNALIISPHDAGTWKVLTLYPGDMVRISIGGRSMEIPVYVLPGQPDGVVGLPLGYGRMVAGPIGTRVGFNVYPLRTSANWYGTTGAGVGPTGEKYDLALTQNHQLIDAIGIAGRQERVGTKGASADLIHEASFDDYKADRNTFKRDPEGKVALQLFQAPSQFNTPHAWGMTIDMTACIGCNACVAACQAENNIPIVGKDQAKMGRAMHWMRIDRYFRGDASGGKNPANDPNPEVVYQPMLCQHCETAPCEQVCPVGATQHDTEGLNVMVYNRCIGTRYCSNNCPYKVRRFNYLDWQSQDPRHDKYPVPFPGIPDQQQLQQVDTIKRMVFNPDVTVRMRGVMEKCTYCIQRIHSTTQAKRAAGQDVADGDILTACQQTCPTQAIVFGNLNDANAKVTQLQQSPRAYKVLDEELNTRPRTQYLARIRNT